MSNLELRSAEEAEQYYAKQRERLPNLKKPEMLELSLRFCDLAEQVEFELMSANDKIKDLEAKSTPVDIDKIIKEQVDAKVADIEKNAAAKLKDKHLSAKVDGVIRTSLLRNKDFVKKVVKWNIPASEFEFLTDEDKRFNSPSELWSQIRLRRAQFKKSKAQRLQVN